MASQKRRASHDEGGAAAELPPSQVAAHPVAENGYRGAPLVFTIWEDVFALMHPSDHSRHAMVCETWAVICARLMELRRSALKYDLAHVPISHTVSSH